MRLHLRWLLPPLLGFAGFLASREMTGQASQAGEVAREQESKLPRLLSSRDLQQGIDALHGKWQVQDDREAEEIRELSSSHLRTKIEGLLRKVGSFDDDADWSLVDITEKTLFRAVIELGKRDGESALRWIEEKSPAYRGHLMAGWAEADPDGAWRAVISSKRKPPCFPETMMNLLQHKASGGAAALREACTQVPWELVLANVQDPFREGLQLASGADVRPWIESGAAEAMAKDGIAIWGFFREWASVDPDLALEKVQSWEDPRNPFPTLVYDLLRAGLDGKDRRDGILRALEDLPDEELGRIADGLIEFGETNPGREKELLKLYPILTSTTSENKE